MEIKSTNYRNMHLKIRNAMTQEEVTEKSRKMVRILLISEWYRQAAEVFVYSPIGKEADCRGLIEQAWRDGKRVAFPRVESENRMNFYYVDCYEDLAEGSFHVAEPKMGCRPAVPDNQPVLVPGAQIGGTALHHPQAQLPCSTDMETAMDMARVIMTGFSHGVRSLSGSGFVLRIRSRRKFRSGNMM